MVFPLGMYTASTVRLSQALEIPFLLNIPRYFVFIAILAWVITYLGMGKQIIKSLRAS
jgi:tellurite resistance protein TehA-like permease